MQQRKKAASVRNDRLPTESAEQSVGGMSQATKGDCQKHVALREKNHRGMMPTLSL